MGSPVCEEEQKEEQTVGHSVRTMIEMSAACLMFVAAVTVGLMLFQSGSAALGWTYESNRMADPHVHSTLSPLAGDGSVSGAEVLQSVAQIRDIGVELVVDGTVYPPDLEKEDVRLSGIRMNGRYKPSYQRGPNGELTRVVFTSI